LLVYVVAFVAVDAGPDALVDTAVEAVDGADVPPEFVAVTVNV
jgi:hypothetical protein